jgi:hypothetical protein
MNMNKNKNQKGGASQNTRKLHRSPSKARQAREEEKRRLRTEAFGRPEASAPEAREDNAPRVYSGYNSGAAIVVPETREYSPTDAAHNVEVTRERVEAARAKLTGESTVPETRIHPEVDYKVGDKIVRAYSYEEAVTKAAIAPETRDDSPTASQAEVKACRERITGEGNAPRGKERKYRYSDANTHTDNLTLDEAKEFQRLQNGGKITKTKGNAQ